MKDSADQSLTQISDFLKNVETDVKNLVNASFDDAKAKAEAYINEFNSNPDLDKNIFLHGIESQFCLKKRVYIKIGTTLYSLFGGCSPV